MLKVVLTGGPCAGKSKMLPLLKEHFTVQGYKVLIVPETSTFLRKSGIVPDNEELSANDFQELLLETQIFHEELFDRISTNYKDVIIIYDRGILDGNTYVEEEYFKELLSQKDLNKDKVYARYDLVFHLVTIAFRAGIAYNKGDNNTVRFEDEVQARNNDRKNYEIWKDHPNFFEIGTEETFNDKMKKVIGLMEEQLKAE